MILYDFAKLELFFSSPSIVLIPSCGYSITHAWPSFLNDSLFSSLLDNKDGLLVVADFSKSDFKKRGVFGEGLRWVGRRGFAGFGVNMTLDSISKGSTRFTDFRRDSYKLREGLREIRKRYGIRRLRIADSSEVVVLEDNLNIASRNVMSWLESKVISQEVNDLFCDGSEDRSKLLSILGRVTYRLHENREFSSETRDILDELRKKILTCKRDLEEARKERPNGASIESLQSFMSLAVSNLFDEKREKGYRTRDIRRAVETLAGVAYNIREGYKLRGWEVREGLVHSVDRQTLIDQASKLAKPHIVRRIAMNELSLVNCAEWLYTGPHRRKKEDELHDFLEKRGGASPYIPVKRRYSNALTLEDYYRLGETRFNDFSQRGFLPYKTEVEIVTSLLRFNINKKKFRACVNEWLEIRGYEPVSSWDFKYRAIPKVPSS